VATNFGNSAGELTTSSTSNIKGGNSDNNRSELDKNNMLKPTFDTLTEEGHKAFKAFCADFKELFLSHCEVMRQGTVLRDTTPIVFNKPEVKPEVQSNPSPSHNDNQSIINSALERQAKSSDELLCRLVEERDGKKLDTASVNISSSTCTISFTQTNPHTSCASACNTSMPTPQPSW
jgi:recombination DNA repair RAD52 pathway protein